MLTLKKRMFVDAYKLSRNATKAAISAGYSPRTAGNYASKLLKDPEISQSLIEWAKSVELQTQKMLEERQKRLMPTKSSYIERTFDKAETITHAPTAAKYWELGGKALGFVGNEAESAKNVLNMQFLVGELRLTLPGREPNDNLANLNENCHQMSQFVVKPAQNLNDESHNTNAINELQIQCPIISDYVKPGQPDSEAPPRPGQDLNVNPPSNSEPILNSVNATFQLGFPKKKEAMSRRPRGKDGRLLKYKQSIGMAV